MPQMDLRPLGREGRRVAAAQLPNKARRIPHIQRMSIYDGRVEAAHGLRASGEKGRRVAAAQRSHTARRSSYNNPKRKNPLGKYLDVSYGIPLEWETPNESVAWIHFPPIATEIPRLGELINAPLNFAPLKKRPTNYKIEIQPSNTGGGD